MKQVSIPTRTDDLIFEITTRRPSLTEWPRRLDTNLRGGPRGAASFPGKFPGCPSSPLVKVTQAVMHARLGQLGQATEQRRSE